RGPADGGRTRRRPAARRTHPAAGPRRLTDRPRRPAARGDRRGRAARGGPGTRGGLPRRPRGPPAVRGRRRRRGRPAPLPRVAAHRAVGVHTAREDVTAARPSRRRTVAELTLLTLAVGAVVALRTRGTSDGSDATGDQLVSLAPVLVAVIAALVLVRLYPLPL